MFARASLVTAAAAVALFGFAGTAHAADNAQMAPVAVAPQVEVPAASGTVLNNTAQVAAVAPADNGFGAENILSLGAGILIAVGGSAAVAARRN